MTNRTLSVGMVAAGLVTLLALSGLPAPAQDKSAKAAPAMEAKESPEGEAVKNIALAYDLAALGRKSDSPEMLLAAAKILGMYKSNPGKDKPKVSGGVDEPTEPLSLSEEAQKLLTEAKEKAKGDKAIIALADAIADGLSRGSYGGPRSYTHQPRSGATLTWNVNFIPGQMARVSVIGNGRNSITLTATFPGGRVETFTGPNPSLVLVPGVAGSTQITVTNNGPGVCRFTVQHN